MLVSWALPEANVNFSIDKPPHQCPVPSGQCYSCDSHKTQVPRCHPEVGNWLCGSPGCTRIHRRRAWNQIRRSTPQYVRLSFGRGRIGTRRAADRQRHHAGFHLRCLICSFVIHRLRLTVHPTGIGVDRVDRTFPSAICGPNLDPASHPGRESPIQRRRCPFVEKTSF